MIEKIHSSRWEQVAKCNALQKRASGEIKELILQTSTALSTYLTTGEKSPVEEMRARVNAKIMDCDSLTPFERRAVFFLDDCTKAYHHSDSEWFPSAFKALKVDHHEAYDKEALLLGLQPG